MSIFHPVNLSLWWDSQYALLRVHKLRYLWDRVTFLSREFKIPRYAEYISESDVQYKVISIAHDCEHTDSN